MRYEEDINEMVAICKCLHRMTPVDDEGNDLPLVKGRSDSKWHCKHCGATEPKEIMNWLKYEKQMDNARDIIAEVQEGLRSAGHRHFVD